MKFNVNVTTKDGKIKDVIEKAVADYLWAHQEDYFGKDIKTIEVTVKVEVTQRPVDRGVS